MLVDDELFARIEFDGQDARLQIDFKVIAQCIVNNVGKRFNGLVCYLMEAGFLKGHSLVLRLSSGSNAPARRQSIVGAPYYIK